MAHEHVSAENGRIIARKARDWGVSLVGFADLAGLEAPAVSGWPRAVSMALALDPAALAGVDRGPTLSYFEEYKRANRALNEIAGRLSSFILSLGYRAEPIPATWPEGPGSEEWIRELSAPFQHKTAATRAGLGWVGRNALLITPAFGPRVRLATVLTDMPLPVGQPQTESGCGDCTTCIRLCPAGALSGKAWVPGLAREELVDAPLCSQTARRLLLERAGAENAVCGVCVAVCPVGRGERGHPWPGV
ncbi:MAG TPA: epoxyqueuosine reductase [Chloroflexi bacterium]|nr:epoxyqueuosine reductase [Chloroflexota bacterium]